MRKYIILLTSVVIVCGTVFFYLLFNVVTRSDYTPVSADYIVILGHSLEDGETPSDWLICRMEEGLKLYELNYASKIVVTGGKPGSYKISVAESMRDWLIERSVPEDDILVEASAANTYENFKFTHELVGDASIIVVTNDFHMYRSMLIARDYFRVPSGSNADTSMNFQKVLAYCKEPLSIIKYMSIHRM